MPHEEQLTVNIFYHKKRNLIKAVKDHSRTHKNRWKELEVSREDPGDQEDLERRIQGMQQHTGFEDWDSGFWVVGP